MGFHFSGIHEITSKGNRRVYRIPVMCGWSSLKQQLHPSRNVNNTSRRSCTYVVNTLIPLRSNLTYVFRVFVTAWAELFLQFLYGAFLDMVSLMCSGCWHFWQLVRMFSFCNFDKLNNLVRPNVSAASVCILFGINYAKVFWNFCQNIQFLAEILLFWKKRHHSAELCTYY